LPVSIPFHSLRSEARELRPAALDLSRLLSDGSRARWGPWNGAVELGLFGSTGTSILGAHDAATASPTHLGGRKSGQVWVHTLAVRKPRIKTDSLSLRQEV